MHTGGHFFFLSVFVLILSSQGSWAFKFFPRDSQYQGKEWKWDLSLRPIPLAIKLCFWSLPSQTPITWLLKSLQTKTPRLKTEVTLPGFLVGSGGRKHQAQWKLCLGQLCPRHKLDHSEFLRNIFERRATHVLDSSESDLVWAPAERSGADGRGLS